MILLHAEAAARCPVLHVVPALAREPESPWEAKGFGDLVPPDTHAQARAHRDDLARLLRLEREASADFLLALADFDRRRGWERLGHAGLFSFLTRELGLSNGAAQLRLSAARLLPRHPAVEAALRAGRLCLSAVGQLARVLTPENEAAVLPRFFGRSAREAAELVAELQPCPEPPRREVVTRPALAAPLALDLGTPTARPPVEVPLRTCELALAPARADLSEAPLRTSEVAPARLARPSGPEVEPLTADLRRLHLSVSKRLLDKLAAARTGLSHAMPHATTEQVLEAALDLLLERQARSKALVKRPRKASTPAAPTAPVGPTPSTLDPAARTDHVPAEVERAVRLRDGNRCQFPLDSGGVCGSTWQVELDHVVPRALGGPTTVENLRCACRPHNLRAAVQELGAAAVIRSA
jgi:hypothetical protein